MDSTIPWPEFRGLGHWEREVQRGFGVHYAERLGSTTYFQAHDSNSIYFSDSVGVVLDDAFSGRSNDVYSDIAAAFGVDNVWVASEQDINAKFELVYGGTSCGQ